MGFLGDIWDSVCDFACEVKDAALRVAETAWEGVKTAVHAIATIGPKVLAIARPLTKALCVIMPQLGIPLDKVLKIAEVVVQVACVAVGLLEPEESVSELGERALEAGERGIHPEDFDNAEDYLNAVRQTPLAADRNKWTEQQRALAGIGTLAYCLEKEFNISPEVYPLFVRYHKFFTAEREEAYIQYALKTGYDLSHLGDYFSSNATLAEKEAALDFMEKAEAAMNPGYDREKFMEELLAAKLDGPEGAL